MTRPASLTRAPDPREQGPEPPLGATRAPAWFHTLFARPTSIDGPAKPLSPRPVAHASEPSPPDESIPNHSSAPPELAAAITTAATTAPSPSSPPPPASPSHCTPTTPARQPTAHARTTPTPDHDTEPTDCRRHTHSWRRCTNTATHSGPGSVSWLRAAKSPANWRPDSAPGGHWTEWRALVRHYQ